jgi:pSer/pThr/pTyr-binding forkhead associated (FHA) protein
MMSTPLSRPYSSRAVVFVAFLLVCLHSHPARGGESARLSSDGQGIVDRVRQAGGKNGTIRFALGWNNTNDLDLHCVDPAGEEIYYHHRQSISGGTLDVDQNAMFPYRSDPVENIRWLENPLPGKYRVYVVHYSSHGGGISTNYRVVAQVGDQLKEFTGSISAGSPKELVGEFDFTPLPGGVAPAAESEGWLMPLLFLLILAGAVQQSSRIKNELARTALFLALGGVLAFFPGEPVQGFATSSFFGYLFQEAIYFLVVGVILAMFLAAFDGLSVGSYAKAWHGAKGASLAGAIGGAVGGAVGQILFQVLAGGSAGLIAKLVARCLGWGVVGAFVGSGPGIVTNSKTRIHNGVLGGLIGGAIGGIAFCFFGGRLGRLISLSILGACIGLFIRAVEAARKRAWLMRIRGYPEGKEWAIDKDEIVIGQNELVDICLLRDRSVGSRHAVIKRNAETYTIEAVDGPIQVNDAEVKATALRDGDRITIGAGALVFRVEGSAPAAVPALSQPASTPGPEPFPPQALARLVNVRGGPTLYLTKEENILGNRPDAGVVLPNEGVEPTHALLKRTGTEWFIFDKSKGAGIKVNGVQITQRTLLPGGATLTIGPLELRFETRP